MSDPNRAPKPPKLHTLNILVATVASIISIVGGIYSLKATVFHKESSISASQAPVLTGIVRDERLARPLRLALVEVSDEDGQVVSTLSTDDNGAYELKDLGGGVYSVKASAPLHEIQEKKIKVQKNVTSTVDFSLIPQEDHMTPQLVPSVNTLPQPPQYPYPAASTVQPPAYHPFSERRPVRYRNYDRNSSSDTYGNTYEPSSTSDETMTQQPPSKGELLAQAGALLIQQMMEKKKKGSQPTS